ncbi:MAG: penicillin acylase family protein [Planctomycetota bacterium]|nr:MAG: penicillin acylase family protein [Planctomycetota bacterium]
MKKLLRPRNLLILFGLLILVGSFVLTAWVRALKGSGLPSREGSYVLSGLESEVQVRFDRWGVPHLKASSLADGARAMGWLHANDRMTQLELGRRLASGRLSEFAGEAALLLDVEARELRLRKTAEDVYSACGSESAELLQAYADGVNAWLQNRKGDLPPFYSLTGMEPEPWTPVDSLCFSVLMSHGLSFAFGRPEEMRFHWIRYFGEGDALAWMGEKETVVAQPILALAQARTAPIDLSSAPPRPAGLEAGGSNNWAVGASRSATGKPLLANDPHLDISLPNRWYQVHLRAPGYEASGMSLPGLPGVVIGQNADLAWAFTSAMLDDHDLFFEQLNDQGDQVRRDDDWLAIEKRIETIRIKGGREYQVEMASTDLGPLLPEDPVLGLPPRSLSWLQYQPVDPLAPFLKIARSKTLDDVRKAASEFLCPAQNLVAAHRDGGLMHTILGRLPQRGIGDGRLPSPAWDRRYHWQGLQDYQAMPYSRDPDQDFLVTANNDVREQNFPFPYGHHFDTSHRAERIRQLLEGSEQWTLETLAAVQSDVVSLYALETVASLQGEYEGVAGKAMQALQAWDGSMEIQGTSALYALVERFLIKGIFEDDEQAAGLPLPNEMWQRWRLLHVLRNGATPERFDDGRTPERQESRQEIVQRALQDAWVMGEERWGPDVSTWNYGELHYWNISHPLGDVPFLGDWFNAGSKPMYGSTTTVAAFGGPWRGFRQGITYGPSMRFVTEAGSPEKAMAVLPAGQSGHPGDPHYVDQNALYLKGELHETSWSEQAISEATVSTVLLQPASGK